QGAVPWRAGRLDRPRLRLWARGGWRRGCYTRDRYPASRREPHLGAAWVPLRRPVGSDVCQHEVRLRPTRRAIDNAPRRRPAVVSLRRAPDYAIFARLAMADSRTVLRPVQLHRQPPKARDVTPDVGSDCVVALKALGEETRVRIV